ncbi:MAG: class I SAM-dependent DNA methyltransferase, partial [Candidatus Brocadiae bacterium]|nr:class I SAM-dependent DNA methyltransferase [Candidatus Brocadiia bacterium]
MDALDFMRIWRDVDLSERSASQQHFCDLCELLDHPKPAEADPKGEWFTFERGATKQSGGEGWADVWKRGFFAWEYKRRHRNLDAAYDQLLEYREALENPPLLVVSDMERIIVHTNFTSTPTEVHEVPLARLAEPRSLEVLRAVFHHPDRLRPGRTSQAITAEAAERIGDIAGSMRGRGLDPHQVAHFLNRIVFCLFAEDIELLPEGLFSRLVDRTHRQPERFHRMLARLFDAMAEGGDFGVDTIRHFNGDLFVRGPVLEMTEDEIGRVHGASRLDWGAVDPSIFGTLFERGMDPGKRSQIGAHYTSREDIETLVEPVVMWPLRRDWDSTKQTVENLLATGRKSLPRGPGRGDGRKSKKPPSKAVRTKARNESEHLVRRFHQKLTMLRVLDPACGSGNFLYVTLQKLKDLEKEVILFAPDRGLGQIMPMVGPWQLHGIEISPYAYDLAQMVVWIGYLQWVKANGFRIDRDPVLRPMEGNFQCKDAILDL